MEDPTMDQRIDDYIKETEKRWIRNFPDSSIYKCLSHSTLFIPVDEPCWGCAGEFGMDKKAHQRKEFPNAC